MKSIQRQAMYQGIPITQHGWKCEDCSTEWWPAFPGSNESCYPVAHACQKAKPKKAEPKSPVPPMSLEDWDF